MQREVLLWATGPCCTRQLLQTAHIYAADTNAHEGCCRLQGLQLATGNYSLVHCKHMQFSTASSSSGLYICLSRSTCGPCPGATAWSMHLIGMAGGHTAAPYLKQLEGRGKYQIHFDEEQFCSTSTAWLSQSTACRLARFHAAAMPYRCRVARVHSIVSCIARLQVFSCS